MDEQNSQGKERDAGKRIVESMRLIGQEPKKQITSEELQKLETAAGRLDQMLKAFPEAERQALTDAAARLDQLLTDIGAGKNVTSDLKRRRDPQNKGE